MTDFIINLLQDLGIFGILISILINIIFGFIPIPSFVITAANITVYDLIGGFFISLIGEACAAVISFYVFRKGLKTISREQMTKFSKFMRLIDAPKNEAFQLVFVLRLIPYIPSGIITYFAAIGSIDVIPFAISSTLGKIPAMAIEVALVFYALQLPLDKLLGVIGIIASIFVVKKVSSSDSDTKS